VTPEQYIKIHDLWDLERLKAHAQHNSVYVIQTERIPDVVMLHYMDECQYDNKWSTFSRMSRGLILDMKNRKVLAYPFDKFFNLGQMPETSYETLEALKGFETSEKLDGSMIIGFINPNDNKLTFTTKGSFDSEHGAYANALSFTSDQSRVMRAWAEDGTLMFELIAKQYQIVVDYKKKGYAEGLYLIGYRSNVINHKLASFESLAIIAETLNLPTFKTYEFNGLDQLIALAKDLPVLDEGFVLRFPGDLMVKVKGSAYLAAHRFISHLSDRNILQAVADGTASDLALLAPEEYRQDVLGKIDHFQKRVADLEKECYTYFAEAYPKDNRREFAFWVKANVPSHLKGFVFKLLDGKQVDRKQMFKVLEEIDNIDGRTRI
jgi:RNA ligase